MAFSFEQLFTPKLVDNASADDLFTVSALPATNILRGGRVRFTNVTAGAVTITAWILAAAGTPGDDDMCYPETSLAANSFVDVDLPIMPAGWVFYAQAGAGASISACHMNGFVQS